MYFHLGKQRKNIRPARKKWVRIKGGMRLRSETDGRDMKIKRGYLLFGLFRDYINTTRNNAPLGAINYGYIKCKWYSFSQANSNDWHFVLIWFMTEILSYNDEP